MTYSNGKIYKISNDYNNEIYVGSTCDTIVKRFSCHKLEARKEHNKHKPLYKLINEIGFDRFRIELIEDYPCEDKYQLRQREGHFIREFGTMNMKIDGRTRKEYQEIWYEKNKETEKEKRKEKYYENIEKEQENNKKYREKNKDVLNEKKREKVYCAACDCWFNKCGQARHNNRLKHIEATKTTSQDI